MRKASSATLCSAFNELILLMKYTVTSTYKGSYLLYITFHKICLWNPKVWSSTNSVKSILCVCLKFYTFPSSGSFVCFTDCISLPSSSLSLLCPFWKWMCKAFICSDFWAKIFSLPHTIWLSRSQASVTYWISRLQRIQKTMTAKASFSLRRHAIFGTWALYIKAGDCKWWQILTNPAFYFISLPKVNSWARSCIK